VGCQVVVTNFYVIPNQVVLMNKKNLYLGIGFLIIQVLTTIRTIFIFEDYSLLIHFCHHMPLLLGIYFLVGNYEKIRAFVMVGFIPQLIWYVDYFLLVFLNYEFMGYTTYVMNYDIFSLVVSLLTHLVTIVAFFFIMKEEVKLKSVLGAFSYLIILFIITISFTTYTTTDYNCVYNACFIEFLQFDHFRTFWIFIVMGCVVIPTYFIMWGIKKIYKKEK
jgi:hypothetical protein